MEFVGRVCCCPWPTMDCEWNHHAFTPLNKLMGRQEFTEWGLRWGHLTRTTEGAMCPRWSHVSSVYCKPWIIHIMSLLVILSTYAMEDGQTATSVPHHHTLPSWGWAQWSRLGLRRINGKRGEGWRETSRCDLANVVSFGGTIKLSKGSSSVGPCAVCMGTGKSNLVDSSFNVSDVRHVQIHRWVLTYRLHLDRSGLWFQFIGFETKCWLIATSRCRYFWMLFIFL